MPNDSAGGTPDNVGLLEQLRDRLEPYERDPAFIEAPLICRIVLDQSVDDWWAIAGVEFRKRLDARAWPRGTPWERPRRSGQLDYWRIHAFALDQLEELLTLLLPDGAAGFTDAGTLAWIGQHPERLETVAVCLFTGAWDEPGTGQGGADLISLVAHLAGLGQGQAAQWLADWTGIKGKRHA